LRRRGRKSAEEIARLVFGEKTKQSMKSPHEGSIGCSKELRLHKEKRGGVSREEGISGVKEEKLIPCRRGRKGASFNLQRTGRPEKKATAHNTRAAGGGGRELRTRAGD